MSAPRQADRDATLDLLKTLSIPSPSRAALDFARVYGVLAASFLALVTLTLPAPLLAVVFLVVSAQQYALAILTHEGQHYLLARDRRHNDRVAAWLAAAPIGSNFFVTRRIHFAHHDHLGDSAADPERRLHSVVDKVPLIRWLWHFAGLLLGRKILTTYRGADGPAADDGRAWEAALGDVVRVVLVQGLILGALWAAGRPDLYLVFWLAPLLTITVLLDSLRQFCEHATLDIERDAGASYADRLITHLCGPLEAFFMAPLHMNYHGEHHLYPFIPHQNLPRLSRLIRAGTIVPKTPIAYHGSLLVTTWRFLTRIAGQYGILRQRAGVDGR